MSDILVTGGAGFIGTNICKSALDRGYSVRVLDDFSTGSSMNLAGLEVEILQGDVTNPDCVRKAAQGVKYVFHEAAASSSSMFTPYPNRGIEVNVLGFANVLSASVEAKAEKVVYAMTSSMYGNLATPWKEEALRIQDVPNVYGSSLLDRFYIARQIERTLKLKTAGLVYFSVYGPHEKSKKGYANVVTQFLWSIMRGQRPVLYGDGTQRRDFVYVEDVVRANFLAAESEFSDDFVNVGTGTSHSMMEVAEMLCHKIDGRVKPICVPNPIYGYSNHTLADTSKAEALLHFKAKVKLTEGLNRLIEFYTHEC